MMRTYTYRPGGRLLAAVMAFLCLHVVLLTIAIGSSLLQLRLLHQAAQGAEITQQAADANDQRENTITLVIVAEYLILGLLFLSALSRANANAHALGAEGLEYTPGWTVGWFFVPIMNFFKPYIAVRETWRASVPVEQDWRKNRTSYLLPIW